MKLRTSKAVLALVAGMALVLAACGSESGDADTTADENTRIVESTFTGKKVTIPKEPKRIVALWRTGSMLADLEVVPVAALDSEFYEDELGDAYEAVSDVPVIGSYEGVDIQKLIAAEPDLIIGMDNGGLDIDYDEISEVAPTVILKIAEPTDVWDNYPTVANLVNKQTDFDERNAEVDAELKKIADEYGDVLGDLKSTSLGMYDNTLYLDTSKALSYRRIVAAGFGYNAELSDNPERYSVELSPENLPDLADQDVILYDVGLDGTPSPDNKGLIELASFKALPAVKAGHAFPLVSGTIYTFNAAHEQIKGLRAAAETLAADK